MPRVYHLKHATPKMKYQHMRDVLEWRADLREKQDGYNGEGLCPICAGSMQSRPLFMVGEYEMCYTCYRTLELSGIRPPKHVADLESTALQILTETV